MSGETARHYELTGVVDQAVTWYQRAAVAAQQLYASTDANRLLNRARVDLAATIAAVPEGRDTLDLRDAVTLLTSPRR